MAFINPLCTITLLSSDNEPLIKVYRFFGNKTLFTIKHMKKHTKITWNHKNADITAMYICGLVGDIQILIVDNDFGLEETKTIVRSNDELHHTLEKLIEYMTCVDQKLTCKKG